jgi:subtilisin-like proprotein convertase family protein
VFKVTPGPSESEFEDALAVVRSYLNSQSETTEANVEVPSGGGSTASLSKPRKDSSSAAPAATQLSVDGNVDATSFTGDGSNLLGVATDTELATHEGLADSHFDHADSLAELNTQTGASLADGPHTTDTTCLDGSVNCNFAASATEGGAALSAVSAQSGDSATGFFPAGQIEEPRIADEIARDSEVASLGASVWSLTGNASTDSGPNFLGTTDDEPLVLAANSAPLLRLTLGSVSHSEGSTATPIDIPDNFPPGVEDTITVGDYGNATSFSVSVNLTNSDISAVRVDLNAPDGSVYFLYDEGSTGTSLITTFPSPTAPVSGDLSTWIGRNPVGEWMLTVHDNGFLDNTTDGQLLSWSIDFDTFTDPNVQVLSRLEVSGNLDVGEVNASGMVTAPMFSGDGSAVTSVAALTATALAADPTPCDAGEAVSDIAADGTPTCLEVPTQSEFDAHEHDAAYVNVSGDTLNGPLNMNNNIISNIGAAGTDFTASGGLNLANNLTLANGEFFVNNSDWVYLLSDASYSLLGIQVEPQVTLSAGWSAAGVNHDGGDFVLRAGDGDAGAGGFFDQDGGDIILEPGDAAGTGMQGTVNIKANTPGGVLKQPGLIVVDSLGVVVGEVLGWNDAALGQAITVFWESGNPVPLFIRTDELKTNLRVYYSDLNCTGQAAIEIGPGRLEPVIYGIGKNPSGSNRVFFRSTGVYESSFASQSNSDVASASCNSPSSNVNAAWLAVATSVDPDALFTEPFHIE